MMQSKNVCVCVCVRERGREREHQKVQANEIQLLLSACIISADSQ